VSKLNDSMSELRKEASIFTDSLDCCSETIKSVEKAIELMDINIPFEYKFKVEDSDWALSWDRDERANFRLLCKPTSFNSKLVPLIECKIDIRVKLSVHLVDFINAFKEDIKQMRIKLEELV
jgi:hypothetical protein